MDSILSECKAEDFMDEPWNSEFLDSIFLNDNLLEELTDPNKINEISSFMDYEDQTSPMSSESDFAGFQEAGEGENELNMYLKPFISSNASDSGLSSDSPDYEPLSPTMSSPGPSISERECHSPPQFQKMEKPSKVIPPIKNAVPQKQQSKAVSETVTLSNSGKGVKRTHSAVGGPKPKEVKIYRVTPATNVNSAQKKGNLKPQATVIPQQKPTNVVQGVKKVINVHQQQQKSIILPVTDLKTIKIINASTLKAHPNLKLAAANLLQQSKQGLLPKNVLLSKEHYQVKEEPIEEPFMDDDDEEEDIQVDDDFIDYVQNDNDDDDDFDSPRHGATSNEKLVLTTEEKRLLVKEGITLPQNYPLTKHEERELKRIRRKIRNKISAQDSRKRKKEYVDGLEERVKKCTDENQSLMKKIKQLQGQNQNLVNQMKKLQNLLSKNGATSSTAQPATCLMVLLLSMALIAAPNLKLSKRDAHAKETELAEAIQESLKMQQNRRTLLFDSVNNGNEEDDMDMCNETDFVAENENFIENFLNRIGVGGSGIGVGKAKKAPSAYSDLDLDETVWRQGEIQKNSKGGGAKLDPNAMFDNKIVDLNLGNSASSMDKTMENFLIMELRNNLLNQGAVVDVDSADAKINNSMHHNHQSDNVNPKLIFQD